MTLPPDIHFIQRGWINSHWDHLGANEAIRELSGALTAASAATADIMALPGHGTIITDVSGSLERLAAKLARFKAYPEKMAQHLLRRVAITTVLMLQPVSRDGLLTYALARP